MDFAAFVQNRNVSFSGYVIDKQRAGLQLNLSINPKDTYEGDFLKGKFHGQGTYTFSNGLKYVGSIQNGKFHGQGIRTFAYGNMNVGALKTSKYHGAGTGGYYNEYLF